MREERWRDLIKSLERLMPYYSRMNKIMSLGNEEIIRKMSLRNINDCCSYLDAGTGPGDMALLVKKSVNVEKTFLLDPSRDLLHINHVEGEKIVGAFESMPFKDNSFDLITCAFSFRDAVSHRKAAKEISRVMKSGGKAVIVDIRKPEHPLQKFFFYLYIMLFPILSSIIVTKGKMVHEYFTLFFTYIEYPSEWDIVSMFRSSGLVLVDRGSRFGGSLFYHVWKKM